MHHRRWIVAAILLVAGPVPSPTFGSDAPVRVKRTLQFSWRGPFQATFEDYNGDGIDELVVVTHKQVEIVDGLHGVLVRRLELEPEDPSALDILSVESMPDVDGDGLRDFLFGIPSKTVSGRKNAGVIRAVRGSTPHGPVGPESLLYSVEGDENETFLGQFLGTTSTRGITTSELGFVLFDLVSGETVARIRAPVTTAYPSSVSGLGDLDGDGIEDFVVAGSGAYVLDGSVTTQGWVVVTDPALDEFRLALLESSAGYWPGTHGGAGDREMFANLGGLNPGSAPLQSLIVSGDAHHSGATAHVLTAEGEGALNVREVASIPGSTQRSRFGHDVVSIGDADGDGVFDVAIFEQDFTADGDVEGRIVVLSGGGLADGYGEDDVIQEIESVRQWRLYGGLRDLGDSDGDGLRELAAMGLDQQHGHAFVDVYSIVPGGAAAPDCNHSGSPDFVDLQSPSLRLNSPELVPIDSPATAIAASDLDGDGDTDLAVVQLDTPGIVVLRNRGDGSFEPLATIDLEWEVPSMIAADLDGDGRIDLATADNSRYRPDQGHEDGSTISILRGLGDATFEAPRPFPVGLWPSTVVTADFDGDGDADLLVRSAPVVLLRNDGTGSFDREENFTTYDGEYGGIAAADLDGDGDVDLAVSGSQERIWPLLNSGNGYFVPAASSEEYMGGEALLTGDFDGDGVEDMAATGFGQYSISVLLNRGGATFEGVHVPVGLAEGVALAAADLDGDGDLDLATGNRDGEAGVWTFQNNGGGSFFDSQEFPAGQNSFAIVASDLDGDGKIDLAVSDMEALGVYLLFNSSTPAASLDCNGNGQPDECDIASGVASDRNQNGIPDGCERARFHRGDANDDGRVDLTDGVRVIRYSLFGETGLGCFDAADSNDDNRVDISDAVYLLNFLFRNGPSPPSPGPLPGPCGLDPDGDSRLRDTGCESYRSC